MTTHPGRAGAACSRVKPVTRGNILDECKKAALGWRVAPGRNLVLMFDGTGNILGNHHDTNVVKLMRAIGKSGPGGDGAVAQLVYYDPGVGSSNNFPASSISGKARHLAEQVGGLALGSGAFEDIAQGYEFLVRHYQDGDRIFLFGFSRGAFTARALGGMINMYGLVYPTGLSMLPLMVSSYFAKEKPADVACGKKQSFNDDIVRDFALGRRPLIHFVGVWDTVETIGSGIAGGVTITNPPNIDNKRFVHVRHALAVHETRDKYSPRLYDDPAFTAGEQAVRSFEQRWFTGAHSDVGGSYEDDGLSCVTLQWMADAAGRCGLHLTQTDFIAAHPRPVVHDQSYDSPFWIWTGLNTRPRKLLEHDDPACWALEHARRAGATGRASPWIGYLGAMLIGFVILLAGMAIYFTASACGGSGPSAQITASLVQFIAPWQAQSSQACSVEAIGPSLRWGALLVVAYCAWLPYPITWAVRRLAVPAILAGTALPLWLAHLKRILPALFIAALCEQLLAALLVPSHGTDFSARVVEHGVQTVGRWLDFTPSPATVLKFEKFMRCAILRVAQVCTIVKIGAWLTLLLAVMRAALQRKR